MLRAKLLAHFDAALWRPDEIGWFYTPHFDAPCKLQAALSGGTWQTLKVFTMQMSTTAISMQMFTNGNVVLPTHTIFISSIFPFLFAAALCRRKCECKPPFEPWFLLNFNAFNSHYY